jgi:hypothetical protein
VSFDQIFVILFVTGWALCGLLAWLAASVLTRGHAGLVMLPASMATSVLFALLVPFLGATGVGGIWLSFVAAVAAPSLLLAARRFALYAPIGAARPPAPGANPGETPRGE